MTMLFLKKKISDFFLIWMLYIHICCVAILDWVVHETEGLRSTGISNGPDVRGAGWREETACT